jgi:hypothetical protein
MRLHPELLLPAIVALALAPLPTTALATPLGRSYTFKATYTGTVAVQSGSLLATRSATGKASVLGASTLSAADTDIHIPESDPAVTRVAGEGHATLTAGTRGSIMLLYVFTGDPVASGYYIIFGGTGKFAGATGAGRFREVGSANPGQQAGITDTFKGTLILPSK